MRKIELVPNAVALTDCIDKQGKRGVGVVEAAGVLEGPPQRTGVAGQKFSSVGDMEGYVS